VSASDNLRVEVESERERVIVRLEGELDLASAPLLERALERSEVDAAATVVFDLDGLRFIDSTGLRVLLSAHRKASEAGREFAITRGSPQVQRLLDITRVAERLTVVPSAHEASA
jgi:anti-sigma B factor antagonist